MGSVIHKAFFRTLFQVRTVQIVGSFMILNGTINYLQLREHKKFQKLVNVPSPTLSDDNSGGDSDTLVADVSESISASSAAPDSGVVPTSTVAATTSVHQSTMRRILARTD
jgi:hypothetical protein